IAENFGDEPRSPATEAMLIIFPRRCVIMTLPTACEKRNVPVKFVSMTLFHCSRVIASTGAPQEVPALLIKMSMRPNCLRVASATSWILEGCLTSQPSARTCTPSLCSSSAACRQRSFLRAHRTRFAPISARPSAICRPSPTEPPVTIATRPARSKIGLAVILLAVSPDIPNDSHQRVFISYVSYYRYLRCGPTSRRRYAVAQVSCIHPSALRLHV